MGAGASTIVSPAPHPQQHSTSVVPYVDRDRHHDRTAMNSPVVYQPVPAPTGGMLSPYDLAPWYAHYARSMLPRRPFTPWGVGMGPMDWDAVPPLGRMMVDVRVKSEDQERRAGKRSRRARSRSRDRSKSRDRGRDRDRARGKERDGSREGRSRTRHRSRGRSRGGWYSSDEGRSRGRWWSRSRGRRGCDTREKTRRNQRRRGRNENWRRARGDDLDEEIDIEDFDEDLDDLDDLDEDDFLRGRARPNTRAMKGWHRHGRKGKQKSLRGQDPFFRVTDPTSRSAFRHMGQRIDSVDERLINLEDYVRAAQDMGIRPSRENARFPRRHGGGHDFGFDDEYEFGGRGERGPGGMRGRGVGMAPRGPPFGRGGGPFDNLDDEGMGLGFGDDDGEC